jgi:2-polyprenyl-3-methyl-5-hydroxy-6-metoxy-1,4-benzoquinol methylase
MILSTQMAIEETMALCQKTVYTEERSQFHTDVTKTVWEWSKKRLGDLSLTPDAPIVDVGCGCGVALEMFEADGREAVGITTNKEEIAICNKAGFNVLDWDMADISQLTNYASGIWLRHAAEHSFAPFVLLRSCHGALKENGWLYLEVPAPDTSSKHEENKNHYSVLGKNAWASLLVKAGFYLMDTCSVKFETPLGNDEYLCFLCRKL